LRAEVLAALSPSRIAAWQKAIEPVALDILQRLETHSPVDLVRDFALPWSRAVAWLVTQAAAADGERVAHLASQVSASAADPFDETLQSEAAAAGAELERLLPSESIPLRAPTFVALSQTLPAFLANAWLGLLRHPAELLRLRDQPDLMPQAMNELLRYAGIARMIFRRATADIEIGSIKIAQGERAVLMLASANRDPVQFPHPDRLNLTRSAAGHVALGLGPHSCVGAALIRMAASVATGAFAMRFADARLLPPIEWRGGPGFCSLASLTVAIL
jgi:cytochrome P450